MKTKKLLLSICWDKCLSSYQTLFILKLVTINHIILAFRRFLILHVSKPYVCTYVSKLILYDNNPIMNFHKYINN